MDNVLEKLQEQTIKNLDLTQFDFTEHKIDFSGKTLEGVDFSGNKTLEGVNFSRSTLKEIKFCKSVLTGCKFIEAKMDSCDFTSATIQSTGDGKIASFKGATIDKTKFKKSTTEVCDFRYANITNCSFYKAVFKFTDFHRTAFKGITVFQAAQFKLCSLSYVAFENYCITRDNLPKKYFKPALVQENEKVYKDFLKKMSVSKNGVKTMFKDAERIYRQFGALWEGKGHNKDAEWAYVQGKRMERRSLLHESPPQKIWDKVIYFFSLLSDIFLGYGVSLRKALCTYLLMIVIFGLIYNSILDDGFLACLKISAGYTIGIGEAVSPREEIVSMVQRGVGMLLTGFMGFVVANKIRKS